MRFVDYILRKGEASFVLKHQAIITATSPKYKIDTCHLGLRFPGIFSASWHSILLVFVYDIVIEIDSWFGSRFWGWKSACVENRYARQRNLPVRVQYDLIKPFEEWRWKLLWYCTSSVYKDNFLSLLNFLWQQLWALLLHL